jgi:hypothetical protein
VFFQNSQINGQFSKLAGVLRLQDYPKPFTSALLDRTIDFLDSVIQNPKAWDDNTFVSIADCGEDFLKEINSFGMSTEEPREKLGRLFPFVYRFSTEYSLRLTKGQEKGMLLGRIDDLAGSPDFSAEEQRKLRWVDSRLHLRLVKDILGDPTIDEIRKQSITAESIRTGSAQWDADLTKHISKVEELKGVIRGLRSDYNFVGLSQGFSKLRTTKNSEKQLAFWVCVFLAALVLVVPIAEIAFIAWNAKEIEKLKNAILYSLPALVAIEIFLVYFFRVVLTHFRSIKAQILQIELRLSLCQFIESYSEYATQIASKSPHSLAKFESVIFSNLVASEEGIPSTFDGMEQFTKLLEKFRSR